jgi:hypothetical protein
MLLFWGFCYGSSLQCNLFFKYLRLEPHYQTVLLNMILHSSIHLQFLRNQVPMIHLCVFFPLLSQFTTWACPHQNSIFIFFFQLASTVLIGPWPSLMDFSIHIFTSSLTYPGHLSSFLNFTILRTVADLYKP